ncbi:RNA-binding (RRM/RBD/RNP motifs) family protein [Raphanus sativus]|uniref:28 kDa ribonucleoprotein, chloroplastic n=1 Tax=Raphanus sativus TaxID=3726 RepID=A0A9W3D4V6_RAPSA|nr:28 kDa ribonucleoprotein, chloroplastic [Raphanus sativus]XP_056858720.1 28 kDa ribonucleoprotein, chloroplastic [Raphanus sativus]XP_056858723.1 28 kDa ribonucleoprotein, chloroplastic [Raphanus sativus]XP_056858724.1 28 kDa ribonucleoprotein, chloroplastic [Raphanus sativus]KAJ4914567.1 RNA-binding (RRM/RBD/RNP motifs) family protein [Raphanus sativus]
MAASSSCFAIPLSSSRSSSNAIPKCKTLTSSCFYVASLKASTTSFHLSSLSRQRLQLKVFSSSSELSVLDEATQEAEDEVKVDGETGEETEAEPVVTKKPRPCELYVCNIPRSYDITQLLDMFQSFGTVISVEVSRNPETGESRGSGYVTMSSINSAKNAIASLDGNEVGGREMRVRYSVDMNPGTRKNTSALNSTPKKILMYESPYKVYVGNLPWLTQPDGLRDHFSQFGTVVSTRVLHDRKTGKNRVFAFLSFANLDERDAALSLNGTEYEGRRIIVRQGIERTES